MTLGELDRRGLPTLRNTIATTAILEAGRRSLDERRGVDILSGEDGAWHLRCWSRVEFFIEVWLCVLCTYAR